MSDVSNLIKTLARDAVEGSKPAAVQIGTVLSPSPLKIQVDQKLILTEEFLVLTKNVVDYTQEVTIAWQTEDTSGGGGESAFSSHSHGINGRKKITYHNALKAGDKVLLLRNQGGQQFIVLDKVGGGTL